MRLLIESKGNKPLIFLCFGKKIISSCAPWVRHECKYSRLYVTPMCECCRLGVCAFLGIWSICYLGGLRELSSAQDPPEATQARWLLYKGGFAQPQLTLSCWKGLSTDLEGALARLPSCGRLLSHTQRPRRVCHESAWPLHTQNGQICGESPSLCPVPWLARP